MQRLFLFLGACNAFVGVALGAFGAHALRGQVEDYYYEVFQTGVLYQSIHALAIILVGLTLFHMRTRFLISAGWLFQLGIALFSGSLYMLAITGSKVLGIVTPIGGACFLLGWLCFASGIMRKPRLD